MYFNCINLLGTKHIFWSDPFVKVFVRDDAEFNGRALQGETLLMGIKTPYNAPRVYHTASQIALVLQTNFPEAQKNRAYAIASQPCNRNIYCRKPALLLANLLLLFPMLIKPYETRKTYVTIGVIDKGLFYAC
jgi:hypothetical protein